MSVTVARLARIRTGHGGFLGSVKERFTFLAVDAVRVVLAILADATTIEFSMDVHTHFHSIDFFVVLTCIRVLMAVAFLAFEFVRSASWLPFLLFEPWAAAVASRATCIITADAFVPGDAVGPGLALISESIAHATTSNGDVFDGVVVPSCDSFVFQGEGEQVSEQSFDVEQH